MGVVVYILYVMYNVNNVKIYTKGALIMKFDLVFIFSLVMFAICTISLGYTIFRCFKGDFVYNPRNNYKSMKIKELDYNLYLDITDYITYEKYQIWRFYFPA